MRINYEVFHYEIFNSAFHSFFLELQTLSIFRYSFPYIYIYIYIYQIFQQYKE